MDKNMDFSNLNRFQSFESPEPDNLFNPITLSNSYSVSSSLFIISYPASKIWQVSIHTPILSWYFVCDII